jgi:hypothetical protein
MRTVLIFGGRYFNASLVGLLDDVPHQGACSSKAAAGITCSDRPGYEDHLASAPAGSE